MLTVIGPSGATSHDGGRHPERPARIGAVMEGVELVGAVLAGDFSPSTFKPMTGVQMARDVLDAVDHGNQRFLSSLSDDQRAALGQHPFDFGDYLLFSTRWEDALGYGK